MSLLIIQQLAEALLKIQDQEQAAEIREHDVSAHQECIAALQEKLLAEGAKIVKLESDLLNKTSEMNGIDFELKKRNEEVHSLKKELEQYTMVGQLRIAVGGRPSPAFNLECHDHAKANPISDEQKERCLAYDSASAEDPYEGSEGSVYHRESSIRSSISPNLDGSGVLDFNIDEDGDYKIKHNFANLAEELGNVGENLDCDSESDTSDYFAVDSTLAASGNDNIINKDWEDGNSAGVSIPVASTLLPSNLMDASHRTGKSPVACEARTSGNSVEGNTLDVVNGQESRVSDQLGIELEPPQCATNHLMHQGSPFTSNTTGNLSSDIEMMQDTMGDGNETNMQ